MTDVENNSIEIYSMMSLVAYDERSSAGDPNLGPTHAILLDEWDYINGPWQNSDGYLVFDLETRDLWVKSGS